MAWLSVVRWVPEKDAHLDGYLDSVTAASSAAHLEIYSDESSAAL